MTRTTRITSHINRVFRCLNTHIERTFIASNDRTVARTDFASKHLHLIIKGSRIELDGWCNAYNEAIKLIDKGVIKSFREYAELSACKGYTMHTIKTYLSDVSWAVNDSRKPLDSWDSIAQINKARYPKKAKGKAKTAVKPSGKGTAYDAVREPALRLSRAGKLALIAELTASL